jgi:hypothetical protein
MQQMFCVRGDRCASVKESGLEVQDETDVVLKQIKY